MKNIILGFGFLFLSIISFSGKSFVAPLGAPPFQVTYLQNFLGGIIFLVVAFVCFYNRKKRK
jgi:hypothetical protein